MPRRVKCSDCGGFFPRSRVGTNGWGERVCERCEAAIVERIRRADREREARLDRAFAAGDYSYWGR